MTVLSKPTGHQLNRERWDEIEREIEEIFKIKKHIKKDRMDKNAAARTKSRLSKAVKALS